MFFKDDQERMEELRSGAKEAIRSTPGAKKCPRCGASRELIDKGVCKGKFIDPKGTTRLCMLKW